MTRNEAYNKLVANGMNALTATTSLGYLSSNNGESPMLRGGQAKIILQDDVENSSEPDDDQQPDVDSDDQDSSEANHYYDRAVGLRPKPAPTVQRGRASKREYITRHRLPAEET